MFRKGPITVCLRSRDKGNHRLGAVNGKIPELCRVFVVVVKFPAMWVSISIKNSSVCCPESLLVRNNREKCAEIQSVKCLTGAEGLKYFQDGMSAVIGHRSVQTERGQGSHIQSGPPAPSLLLLRVYSFCWVHLRSVLSLSLSFFSSLYSTGSPPRPAWLPHAVFPGGKLSHFLLFLCKISSAPLLISMLQGSCRA